MTTKTAGAAPKKGSPAKANTTSAAALTRAFSEQRRTVLTRDAFLRSQGPPVVEVSLGALGVTVLMRRVDLLDLARRGADYYPFRSAVYGMIRMKGLYKEQLEVDGLADTLDLAARIALDTIVVPPDGYLEAADLDDAEHEALREAWQAEITAALDAGDKARADVLKLSPPPRPTTHTAPVLAAVRAADLRPLFVEPGEQPDEDQVVLRYALPDDDGGYTDYASGEGGGIPPADLVSILKAAYDYGPGAMGRRFRGDEPEAPSLGALLDLAKRGA